MSGTLICELLTELLEIIHYEKSWNIATSSNGEVSTAIITHIIDAGSEFIDEYISFEKYKLLGNSSLEMTNTVKTFINKCSMSTVIFSYVNEKITHGKKGRNIPKILSQNDTILEQYCMKCGTWKQYDQFGKKRNATKAECIPCTNNYGAGYRKSENGAAKIKAKDEKYKKSDKRKEVMHKRYLRNRETELKKAADRRANRTPEQILANALYMKNYRASPAHKIRAKELLIQFHIKNPLWKKTYMKNYMIRRYFTDPAFRAICKLRRALYKINKGVKSSSTSKYLGCTIEQYLKHISSLFTGDMSWENEGSYWHVDHIIPVAAFDGSEEEKMCCWNYQNLQPLGAVENMAKNSFVTRELFESQRHRLIQSVIDRIENGFETTGCNRIKFMKLKAIGYELPEDEIIEESSDDEYDIEELQDEEIDEIITDLVAEDELIEDEIENITENMDQVELKEFTNSIEL